MNRRLIFIGGAPTTGKTTIAKLLSEKLSLPWASTDQIRSTMQAVARKEDYPALFNASDYSVERFLTELSAEKIVDMEMDQADEVWIGVKAFANDWSWKDGGIIEGVNILPHLISEKFKGSEHVRAIFLIDRDEDRMRDVIYTRGLWGHAHTYSDDLKEKELEWAKLFGDRLQREAQKYGYPVIDISKSDSDIDAVLKHI